MLAALIVVPAGAILALLFAAWLAWDVLGSPRAGGATGEAAESVRRAVSSVALLHGAGVLALGLVLSIAAGVAVGALNGSLEDGMLAGLAAMAGVISIAASALASATVVARAPGRVAAAPRGYGPLAGRAAAVGAFVVVGLTLASLGGLVALATRVMDNAPADAPLLLVAFAPGALVAALLLHLGATALSGTPLDAAEAAAVVPFEGAGPPLAALIGSPVLAGALAAALAGSMVLAAPLTRASGDAEWLLFPLVLSGFGVVAAIAGLLAWSGWERLTAGAREGIGGAHWTAVVVAALGLVAGSALTLGDRWYWPFFAALTGLVGAALVVTAGQLAGARRGAGTFDAAAIAGATLAAVVAIGFALGRKTGLAGVDPVAAGLFGVGVALAAFLMPVVLAKAVAGSGGIVRAVAGLRLADAHAFAAAAQAAGHAARTYAAAAVALAGLVLLLAFLSSVREEFGRTAFDDPERYAANVHALGILPPEPGFASAAAIAALDYADDLVAVRTLSERDRQRLMVANGHESAAIADALGLNDESAQRLSDGSPVPLPALLPLNVARPEAAGGALAAILALALASALATRVVLAAGHAPGSGPAELTAAAGRAWRWLWLPALTAVLLPAVIGAAFRFGFRGEGNEGWLALGGAAVAAFAGALVFALMREAPVDGARDGSRAGAVQLTALLLPAVGLLVVPLVVS